MVVLTVTELCFRSYGCEIGRKHEGLLEPGPEVQISPRAAAPVRLLPVPQVPPVPPLPHLLPHRSALVRVYYPLGIKQCKIDA